MHHYENMQYLNTVYPERHYAVKNVDDRMKYKNVGKYMTFTDNTKKKMLYDTSYHSYMVDKLCRL